MNTVRFFLKKREFFYDLSVDITTDSSQDIVASQQIVQRVLSLARGFQLYYNGNLDAKSRRLELQIYFQSGVSRFQYTGALLVSTLRENNSIPTRRYPRDY
jgi:hypothetical protein